MSPEKQRIAIATACGWTDIRRQNLYAGDRDLYGNRRIGGEKHRNRLPDYLGDLNAMHEAQKVLKGGMRSKYDAELTLICSRDYNFIWESTAPQLSEAFLRALGLWEEEQ